MVTQRVSGCSRRFLVLVPAIACATACGAPAPLNRRQVHLPAPLLVPACRGDQRPYSAADSGQGSAPAQPVAIVMPASPQPRGKVIVAVYVTIEGQVPRDSIRVVESGGQDLDAWARDEVARWSYSPAVRRGCSVPAWVRVTFNRR
jgi:TonB family protein